jgi:hypothetical protein
MNKILKSDLMELLKSLEVVANEDSCCGSCFVSGKYYSEDAFYGMIKLLEKEETTP